MRTSSQEKKKTRTTPKSEAKAVKGEAAKGRAPIGHSGAGRAKGPDADAKLQRSTAAPATAARARQMLALLERAHPDAHCELVHGSPFELLVATVLSAQSTDVGVNKITPELFRRWGTPEALGNADAEQVQAVLGSLGMFRQKTKNITKLSQLLVARHGGHVPRTLAELVELPGVGRKTANVVLGVAWNAPEGVVVDTHVQRISQRLGWTQAQGPEPIEQDLMQLFDRSNWDRLSHTLIFHGRRVCTARKPACSACSVRSLCPSAFQAENVGRKPLKKRPSAKPSRG